MRQEVISILAERKKSGFKRVAEKNEHQKTKKSKKYKNWEKVK